ncbi:hypothetical protein RB597_008956 [Gaeumannomyces tritici]
MTLKTLSARAATALDQELMSTCAFSLDQLMELAGLSVSQAVFRVHPPSKGRRVLIACGPGNNGGDGLVAARHLRHYGYQPAIYYPKRGKNELYQVSPLVVRHTFPSACFPSQPLHQGHRYPARNGVKMEMFLLLCSVLSSFSSPFSQCGRPLAEHPGVRLVNGDGPIHRELVRLRQRFHVHYTVPQERVVLILSRTSLLNPWLLLIHHKPLIVYAATHEATGGPRGPFRRRLPDCPEVVRPCRRRHLRFSGEVREPFPAVIRALEETQVPVTSVDAPSSWDIENGPPKSGLGSNFNPAVLVSLTAPKPLAQHFRGRHFVGGRFVTPAIAKKYELELPEYEGLDQVAELGPAGQKL